MSHADIQKVAISDLKRDGEPTKCHRCGGRPGEPGCGKIIHVIMDTYYQAAKQVADAMEA